MPSLLPWILSWGGLLLPDWSSPSVACVTPVLRLCSSYRGQATFGEATVGRVLSSSPGSSSPRWSRQPAAGAAGPMARTGPLYLAPWRLLGCQPADSAALGIPPKSSPRHLAMARPGGGPRHAMVWPPSGAPPSHLWTSSHVGKNRNSGFRFV
jgi:hypothetical protein